MNGKIIIRTDIRVLTGLHIGISSAFSAIGAIDAPVIRDKMTQRPIIPGSSLKGKIRTLLVHSMTDQRSDPNEDPDEIRHMFGVIHPNILVSRLQFSDAFLKNAEDFNNLSDMTEAKTENSLNRSTMKATPRTIERVVRGAVFSECIVYNEEKPEETNRDLTLLAKGMKLLQIDYLGGNGTRGSGRISFENITVDTVDAETDREKIQSLFKEAEAYELFSV